MAGIILYGITWSISKLHDTRQQRRSVLLPAPPAATIDVNPTVPDTAPTDIDVDCAHYRFTLRDLKALHRQWQARVLILDSKCRGLTVAVQSGWSVCWAGYPEDLPRYKRARLEAAQIEVKLRLAVQWCRGQGVRKAPYIPRPARKSSRAPRPRFDSFPPTLLTLPWPLPEPPSIEWNLVLPHTQQHPSANAGRAVNRELEAGLPIYTPHANEQGGEQVLLHRNDSFAGLEDDGDLYDGEGDEHDEALLPYEEVVRVREQERQGATVS